MVSPELLNPTLQPKVSLRSHATWCMDLVAMSTQCPVHGGQEMFKAISMSVH
jgi:hypothetical protein